MMAPWVDYALAHGADRPAVRELRKALKGVGENVFVDEHGHVLIGGQAAVHRLVGLGVQRAFAVVPQGRVSLAEVRMALVRPGQPMLELTASVRALLRSRRREADRVVWSLGWAKEQYELELDFVAAAANLDAILEELLGSRAEASQATSWERRLGAARGLLRGEDADSRDTRGLTAEHPGAAVRVDLAAARVEQTLEDPSWSDEASPTRDRLRIAATQALLAAANARGVPDRPLLG